MKKNIILRGFTLIELIIVIVILGIIASIGSTMLHQTILSAYTNIDLLNIKWISRLVLQRMSEDILDATTINICSSTPPCGGSAATTGTAITFTTTSGTYLSYSVSSGNLIRTVSPSMSSPTGNVNYVVSDSVANLNFGFITGTSNKCVNITSTIQRGANAISINSDACARNL
jgi:prepilin-type N-terminal cleavage/methylation domain-containing protein